ncbi:MAG: energy transducer TonB [Saprospiraceae bacterium]|nr:energy transducer TonB [Saprospiraceae bacterium]
MNTSPISNKEQNAPRPKCWNISKNLKYPTLARQQGISGQCVAQFIVSTDGTIENIKIVKDIGEGLRRAVNDVLTSMNNMPQNGILVNKIINW